jgi:hypothetical protein
MISLAELKNFVRDERKIRAYDDAYLTPCLLLTLPRALNDVPNHLKIQKRLTSLKL